MISAMLPWIATGSALHLTSFILVCLYCLRHRKHPSSTILWMFLTWSFPVFGVAFFLVFGADRVTVRANRKRQQNENLRDARNNTAADALPLAYWRAMKDLQPNMHSAGINRINRAIDTFTPDFPLLSGNDIEPLIGGTEAYPAMLHAIRKAKDHIHFQCFIIRNDPISRTFFDAMADQAKQGIHVRVLFDRFGSTEAILTGFFLRYRNIPNFEMHGWTQVNLFKRRLQINLRNHRKTLIIDGKTAFFGGINLDQANLPGKKTEAHRDYHFCANGPIVQQFQYAFLQDWFFMTNEPPQTLLKDQFFPTNAAAGTTPARIVPSGPAAEDYAIEDMFFLLTGEACEQILIVTPYFVPSPALVSALRAAALRGVDVHLILPEHNNHFYAGWAARAFYHELLQAGVRIFLRRPPFIHAKAVLVDARIMTVGTANWDLRSLRLNYETNLLVYDENLAGRLKQVMLEDEAMSQEIHLAGWEARPQWHRLLENACALLAPIL
jgi:cardiolipin synthase A/B